MGDIQIKKPAGATRSRKIVGRGVGSGIGGTSGKGNKGQKARSGGSIKPGFEGGQMPIYRRVARRGFSNHPFKTDFIVINIGSLEKVYKNGETVNHITLVEKGLIKRSEILVKILGKGDLTKKLNVEIPMVSESAREKILKAGGTAPEPVKQENQGE
jgi:large subunit ribosomal protein L15